QAELKSRKAGEALRRAVDKYNAARADFEQRMLDSAMRFQEVEEAHLRHMKGLIGSYSHSVEDTHVQIGQVHEEFKQNVENIGTEMLLRRFAESKGTGRERPGALDFDEYRLAPAQEGKSKAFRIPGLSRKERERDAVGEVSWLVLPGLSLPGSGSCQDLPLPPASVSPTGVTCTPSSADVGGGKPPPQDGGQRAAPKITPNNVGAQPTPSCLCSQGSIWASPGAFGAPLAGSGYVGAGGQWGAMGWSSPSLGGPGWALSCHLCPWHSSSGKMPPDSVPPSALFGPPLESAFEAEDFPAPRAYVLTSSSSPFSSSSPENVEDSGLDSPSHPAPGPSPDSRPWTPQPGTPQSPLPKQGGLPDPQPPPSTRDPNAWAPRPRSPSSRLPEPPNFAIFSGPGAEGLWGDGGAAPQGRSRCLSGPAPREAPSPDPFGEPPPWVRPRSPGGDQPPMTCPSSNSASSSSSSPAPPSGGESSSPSPWTCQGAGMRLSEGGTSGTPTSQSEPGLSRGPSPVVLGSQDALPVATAFTEYVHAYFKGHDADSCLVKVTGELTMSFPAGIVRVFSGTGAPPVLSFRLLNAGAIEQFLPNTDLLYSDPSQSDPSTKDFWLNMAALTGHLQKQAEQSPTASYYNVALLKYQFSRLGPSSAPLRLCVRWDCTPGATRVSVEYGYNAGALALPVPLTNVQVLLPVEEPLTNLRLQPTASWNLEEKRLLWKLLDIPSAPGQGGCGRLSASWEPLGGPSKPSPVAAQFSSEGSTLSGVEVELASAGYRMSLVKKRFATG
ncbi:FCHO1 protein, partial [Furnarius figulus]|nr:FCHO1 protein [Furnarius figulus]